MAAVTGYFCFSLCRLFVIGCMMLSGWSAGSSMTSVKDGPSPGAETADLLRQPVENLRMEVNVRTRELHLFSGDSLLESHPVAVGRPEWPTRAGRWAIYEVVWNPWWHPPNEAWAWSRLIKAPGDRDNPLGRAQLIYDAPRSIHGTNVPSSIGRAVSHGSIRVHNEVVMRLARIAMESGGAGREEEWYLEMHNNRGKNVRITLPEPIPIRVYWRR